VSGAQAVILAGGLGTRLGSIASDVPKAMVAVAGKPFLEHEVSLLKLNGVDDFVFCLGHLGEKVESHFGDGSAMGVSIRYSWDGKRLLGPAGALKKAEGLLEERFFVTYGDAYLRAPYGAMMERLESSGKMGVMSVFHNENRRGRSDVETEGGLVVRFEKSGHRMYSWINYGVTVLAKDALSAIPEGVTFGEEEFYGRLIEAKQLLAFPVTEMFYEIGTPESLAEFERFFSRYHPY
jgi:N-acetyl-alpha-D-muramate 1-phosphate uridylyltransferase